MTEDIPHLRTSGKVQSVMTVGLLRSLNSHNPARVSESG